MSVLTITPLRCPPELYQELCKIFAPKKITPEDTISSVMYQAGQQSVLEYIRQCMSGTEVSSELQKLVKPATYTNRKA